MPDSQADYRLPVSVVPKRYELEISPDLEQATFRGSENIEIVVHEQTPRIVMNALDLGVTDALLRATGRAATDPSGQLEPQRLGVELDKENERVAFVSETEIPPGNYILSCAFTGVLNDKLCGFYRSHFVDESGAQHTVATTQFESTDARRAFPCFDEPDRKAVFSVTLEAPPGMLAVSNGPEIASDDLGNGRHRIRFGDTIPMSTYLVAFVVGPLVATAPMDVDGIALRVIHVPGKERLTAASIDAAAHALRFFARYFAIPYPGEKLDLVAIPDFAAGAMENLGCVTFREAILLADPGNTAQTELERLAEVVEHELAHMWFGDLVTMGWWNGIWLNEAFATYMALLCQDNYHPEWQCFGRFARGKSAALGIDGLHATRPIEFPVRHPDESSAMFDVLTYEKGASVLWMIDSYLGGDRFRDGVRLYLETHKFANTETSDLWDAIESEAGNTPIRSIMDSWIFQGGYPLVSSTVVDETGQGEVVDLTQQPFSYLGSADGLDVDSAIGADWLVPILFAPATAPAEPSRILLGREAQRIDRQHEATVFNAGGSGFYRLHYDPAGKQAILDVFGTLSPLERYNVVSDTWAVVLSGRATLDELFEIASRLEEERDPHVWSVLIGALGLIDLVITDSDRGSLAAYAHRLLMPHLDRVGWVATPQEDDQTPVLRSSLIGALGTMGNDATVIAKAQELFIASESGGAPLDADIASAVLGVVAAHGGRVEFDQILSHYRHPVSPMDEVRHLGALASFRDLALGAELCELCISEIRSQNAPYTLGQMLRNRFLATTTWEFITTHFEALVKLFPESSIHRMLEGISALVELDEHGKPRHSQDVRAFVNSRVTGGRKRLVMQSLERLEVNLRFAHACRPVIGALLTNIGRPGTNR